MPKPLMVDDTTALRDISFKSSQDQRLPSANASKTGKWRIVPGTGRCYKSYIDLQAKDLSDGYRVPSAISPKHGWQNIFGIPCTPTYYEIAFNDPDDEDDAEDTDVDVTVDGNIVSTTPLKPTQAAKPLFQPNPFYTYHELTEPEGRLATISAQPHALQVLLNEDSPLLKAAVQEHAYSQFLMWSDEVLEAIWSGDLGEHFDTHLPAHVEAAVGMFTEVDNSDDEDDEMGTLENENVEEELIATSSL
ncbi:hypothetical protein GN958_ATG21362 [Phytophthora infestans]|uniref:Uncharacterized protein n=1 Tax=Phytophthora infestans TaxID=4787 RepID=A0A8S9TR66_PHYIN|nr:hypothetical protein GN958_ATG21362 [Phytophthora infestans]